MIDTHCHLLPGLDDGPGSLSEALELARALVAQGVQAAVATPHLSRRYPTSPALALGRLDELRAAIAAAGVALEVRLAAEVCPAVAVTLPAESLAPFAIDGRCVVVELRSGTPAGLPAALTRRLARAGLRPILAHPERCRAVQRNPALLDEALGLGALCQVVAPSLVGRWGAAAEASAWTLLGSDRASLLASDAHGCESRPPRLQEAARLVERRLGADRRRRLVETSPRALLA